MKKHLAGWATGAALAILGFVLAFGATRAGVLPPLPLATTDLGATRPRIQAVGPGRQVVFVYLGSPACVWSNRPETYRAIRTAIRAVAARADSAKVGYTTIGASVAWGAQRGVEHLAEIAEFDEISAGSSWLNSLGIKYFWRDVPGAPATPQVLVLLREIKAPLADQGGGLLEVSDEQLLARKVGLPEIERWVALGAPIPLPGSP